MRKLLISLLLVNLADTMSCQQGFYLKPLSYRECFFNHDPFNITLHTKAGNTYQIETRNFVLLDGFDLGLLVGYNFKHWTIESGLIRGASESGFRVRGFSYNQRDSTMSEDFYSVLGGLGFYQFPIRGYYNIFHKDSLFHNPRNISIELSLFAGLDINVMPNTDRTPVSIGVSTWNMGNNQTAEITDVIASTGEPWGTSRNLGISLKFYKRHVNLFNVSLWLTLGDSHYSYEQLTLKDTDGTRYRYYFMGDGSGIFFSWTKEINLRNMRHYVKKAFF